MVKNIITWKIIIILLFVNCVLIGKDYLTTGVKVELSNNSGGTLKAIEIYYNEGIQRISILNPKEKRGFYINPSGETTLEVRWFDQAGRECFADDIGYFTKNDKGMITIDFRPNGHLSSHEDYHFLFHSAW